MSAKAVEETTIIKLPGKAFVDVLSKYPESLVQITQIIMLRLQRVTFTALHSYLGLTSEIMKIEKKNNKNQRNTLHHHHHHHHKHSRHETSNLSKKSSKNGEIDHSNSDDVSSNDRSNDQIVSV